MGRILNVHPGHGSREKKIEILLEYDENGTGKSPNVVHVLFYDNAEAMMFNVEQIDTAKRTLKVSAEIPGNAMTGRISVDLDDGDNFSTLQNFTVDNSNEHGFRIIRVTPTMGAGYPRNSGIVIWVSEKIVADDRVEVFFPMVVNGPPVLRPATPPTSTYEQIRVTVPNGAQNGRVKVKIGNVAALTRTLNFV